MTPVRGGLRVARQGYTVPPENYLESSRLPELSARQLFKQVLSLLLSELMNEIEKEKTTTSAHNKSGKNFTPPTKPKHEYSVRTCVHIPEAVSPFQQSFRPDK